MPVGGVGRASGAATNSAEPGDRRGWHEGCIDCDAMIETLAAIIRPPQAGASTELPSPEASAMFAGLLAGSILPQGAIPDAGAGTASTTGFGGTVAAGFGGMPTVVDEGGRPGVPAGTVAVTLFGDGEGEVPGVPSAGGSAGLEAGTESGSARVVPVPVAAASVPEPGLLPHRPAGVRSERPAPPTPGGTPPVPVAGVPLTASSLVTAGPMPAATPAGAAPPPTTASEAVEGAERVAVGRDAPLPPITDATAAVPKGTVEIAERGPLSVVSVPRSLAMGGGETPPEGRMVPTDRPATEADGREHSTGRAEIWRGRPLFGRPVPGPGGVVTAAEPRIADVPETPSGPPPATAGVTSVFVPPVKAVQPFFAADLFAGDPDPIPGPAVASDPAAGVAAATNRAAAEAPPLPAPPVRTLPVAQLGLFVVRAASQQISHFVVRLEPASLGRVEITLRFKDDGRVAASFRTQQGDALQMLRAEAPAFTRLFAEHGIELAAGGLEFGMMDGGQSDRQRSETPLAVATDADGGPVRAAAPVAPASGTVVGLLDLTV